MERIELEKIYKIDRERLSKYYERITNQSREIQAIENITKFLNNQSIGSTFNEVYKILEYFEDKVIEQKGLLDLAFEWIRAQKIRLEYKKYLIRAQYPNNDLSLAVDDCIYRFFLDYDSYIRKLFKKEVREHNFSALYEIFFSPFDKKALIIQDIIERHIHNIPTHYCGSKKINTRIMTLREGLSNLIVKDYENVMFSRTEHLQIKKPDIQKQIEPQREISKEFNGTNIERIIKTYCFNKIKIQSNVIESAISNFLNSYFKFGTFYTLANFKNLMMQNLAEYIYSGLTEKIKSSNSIIKIKQNFSDPIEEFSFINQEKRLDGSAWVNDLKPVLNEILKRYCDTLFEQF
ncbi:MAG: hypothetical protein EU532_11875 [Promethearchaeota archaeon]|nr:MAG: hypothetical protein EU532_11875 [Candidatus Lokiarchaeota archaeon]